MGNADSFKSYPKAKILLFDSDFYQFSLVPRTTKLRWIYSGMFRRFTRTRSSVKSSPSMLCASLLIVRRPLPTLSWNHLWCCAHWYCKHTCFSSMHFFRFPGFQPSVDTLPTSDYSRMLTKALPEAGLAPSFLKRSTAGTDATSFGQHQPKGRRSGLIGFRPGCAGGWGQCQGTLWKIAATLLSPDFDDIYIINIKF